MSVTVGGIEFVNLLDVVSTMRRPTVYGNNIQRVYASRGRRIYPEKNIVLRAKGKNTQHIGFLDDEIGHRCEITNRISLAFSTGAPVSGWKHVEEPTEYDPYFHIGITGRTSHGGYDFKPGDYYYFNLSSIFDAEVIIKSEANFSLPSKFEYSVSSWPSAKRYEFEFHPALRLRFAEFANTVYKTELHLDQFSYPDGSMSIETEYMDESGSIFADPLSMVAIGTANGSGMLFSTQAAVMKDAYPCNVTNVTDGTSTTENVGFDFGCFCPTEIVYQNFTGAGHVFEEAPEEMRHASLEDLID